jgi:transposase-like protein
MTEYAKRHDISVPSLRYWQRKLKVAANAAVVERGQKNEFVLLYIEDAPAQPNIEDAPAQPTTVSSKPRVFTLLLSGMTLTMPSLPEPEWLAALEHAMQGAR